METAKCLGIWMDHSNANLIDNNDGTINQTIESEFTHQKKIEALSHSESGMHNKEQDQQGQYYKNIGKEILKYDKVLLFGPTDAKLELHNYLMKDDHFKNIVLDVESADKMSENVQIAFVKKHFSKKQ